MDESVLSTMTNYLLLLQYNDISMITYLAHRLGIRHQQTLPRITLADHSLVGMIVRDDKHRQAFCEFVWLLNYRFNLPQLGEIARQELERRHTWNNLLMLSKTEEEIKLALSQEQTFGVTVHI